MKSNWEKLDTWLVELRKQSETWTIIILHNVCFIGPRMQWNQRVCPTFSTPLVCGHRQDLTDGVRKYDTCFLKWYSESEYLPAYRSDPWNWRRPEYLRGNTKDECADLFKKYNTCLMVRTCSLSMTGFGRSAAKTMVRKLSRNEESSRC